MSVVWRIRLRLWRALILLRWHRLQMWVIQRRLQYNDWRIQRRLDRLTK